MKNSDQLNLILCELDIYSTPFGYKTTISYELEPPPTGNKIGFNLIDDDELTIPYILDTTPNSPIGHQIRTQAKNNVWIIVFNK